MAKLLPVRRTTFVIDTDRTILKVVSSEVRATVHADQSLWFLKNRPTRTTEFVQPGLAGEARPSLVRSYTQTPGRTDAGIELALEAPVEVLDTATSSPQWPKYDVRGQILSSCARRTSVAEIAAQLWLPIGATRYLVDDLVNQGYLRVHSSLDDSTAVDERRAMINRTLNGLRELRASC